MTDATIPADLRAAFDAYEAAIVADVHVQLCAYAMQVHGHCRSSR